MSIHGTLGMKVAARIVSVKGHCVACHQEGQQFEISCLNPGDLCGFFFHTIFGDLQTFQFGGSMPWWQDDTITLICPDPSNPVTLELVRSPRE